MIVSRARHPYILNAVCSIGILCVVTIPYYFQAADQRKWIFEPEKFINMITCVTLFSMGGMLFLASLKKKIIIYHDHTIELQLFFGFRKRIYLGHEIVSASWGPGTGSDEENEKGGDTFFYSGRHIEIGFADGKFLMIDEYNYKNYNELRQWFYLHCGRLGIIDVEAIEQKKRERIMRRTGLSHPFKKHRTRTKL